jgi:hypothetical protein
MCFLNNFELPQFLMDTLQTHSGGFVPYALLVFPIFYFLFTNVSDDASDDVEALTDTEQS